MSFILKTNQAAYLLDPSNDSLVLKRKGKWSSVYLGYRVEDKLPVVIKKLHNPNETQTQLRFQREALMGFNFDGVQHTLDAWKDDSGYYIIKEFIDGLSLRQLLQKDIKNRAEFSIKCIIATLDILEKIHSSGIVHADIRPDNILILVNKRGNPDLLNPSIRIIDFGLSVNMAEPIVTQRLPFSLLYSPPEQLLNLPELINASTDLFSLGLTLYESVAKYPPFFNENPEMIMHMQLNTAVAEHRNIHPLLLAFIRKATFKKQLRLPPSKLTMDEIRQTVFEGQQDRFTDCNQMRAILQEVAPNISETEKKSFFKRIFN